MSKVKALGRKEVKQVKHRGALMCPWKVLDFYSRVSRILQP